MNTDNEIIRYKAKAGLSCSEGASVIENPVLDVGNDGRIRYFGVEANSPHEASITHVLDGLIMPGLVNTHAHTPMTLMRGAGQGLPLLRWLHEAIFPRETQMTNDDVFWGMTLGSAELLRNGITTTCEMYMWEHPIVQAAKEIGVRLLMCPTIMDLPDQLNKPTIAERVQQVAEFYDKEHDPDGITNIGYGPHSAYNLGVDGCVQVAESATERDALYHIHLSESRAEDADLREAHGGISATKILNEAGGLQGRVLAAHSVWLDEGDHEIYVDKNISAAHCPVSNMRMGSGNADVAKLRKHGINVGIGTDGPVSNGSLDMWYEIKQAALVARNMNLDERILNPEDVISMATRDGGQALGLEVGTLEVGRWADFIHIDINKPEFTPVDSPEDLISNLAWAGKSHVNDVWVAGKKVVEDGDCLTINLEDSIAKVQDISTRLTSGIRK